MPCAAVVTVKSARTSKQPPIGASFCEQQILCDSRSSVTYTELVRQTCLTDSRTEMRPNRSRLQFAEHIVAQLSKLTARTPLIAFDRKMLKLRLIRTTRYAHGSENRATLSLSFPS